MNESLGLHATSQQRLRQQLAQLTGTHEADWFLTLRSRQGMQLVFEALAEVSGVGIGAGAGAVFTQSYTCATAVNPILAGGLTPYFVDVDRHTISLDPQALAATAASLPAEAQPCAVMLQHTFGIIDDSQSRALRAGADRLGALLIEDSAHCATWFARDEAGLPLADISIHSFGSEKMLPTKFGGAIWINPKLRESRSMFDEVLRAKFAALPAPAARVSLAVRSYRRQIQAFAHLPGALAKPLRSGLARLGVFTPLIEDGERRGSNGLAPQLMTPWTAQQVSDALREFTVLDTRRVVATRTYLEKLADVVDIPGAVTGDQGLLRFPFFVRIKDGEDGAEVAESLISWLESNGHFGGRWYRPALFPGVIDAARYNFDPEMSDLPVSRDLIARAVNLRTLESRERIEELVDLVRQWAAQRGSL